MPSVKRVRSITKRYSKRKCGKGFVNSLINKLPFELHIPGYQYCGPGTRLQKRLARNDPGINELDKACKLHDIAYSKSANDLKARHIADKDLQELAWTRFKASDASVGEKAAAWTITNIMKTKRSFGMGHKLRSRKRRRGTKSKKRIAFGRGIVSKIKGVIKTYGGQKMGGKTLRKMAASSLMAARKYVKAAGGKKKIIIPRIIPIPKTGGFLPLIPIFAGLSALGSLAGAASGIVKAVNIAKTNSQQLTEANRHNRTMEAISLGKNGKGLYLKPYRKGLGLYMKPYRPKNS